MELFRLFGSILIDDKDALDALKKTDKKAKDTKGSLDKVVEGGLKIGGAIYAGAMTAVGGALKLADATAGTADKWDKLSLRTGIGVENLQKWGYAAGQSGADIEKLEVGMKTLTNSMVDATSGSKKAQDAYKKLGISMKDLEKMTPEEAFEKTVYALADMEAGAERNSVGNDLLGKSYTELLPLIEAGTDGINELKDRSEELGIVMSEDSVASGVKFGDTMDDLKDSFGALKDRIMIQLMPKLTELADWIIAHMPEIEETAGKAFDYISGAIEFVIDNSDILIPLLGGLLTAFMALKAISVVNGLIAAFNLVLTLNPIALVVLAIAGLGLAIAGLITHWEDVTGAIKNAWDWLKKWNNTKVDDKTRAIANSVKSAGGGTGGGLSSGAARQTGGVGGGGAFDIGSRYVPYDMMAVIHKGEMIVPKSENPYANSGGQVLPAPSNANISVSLNIENFNNNNHDDIEELASELAFMAKRKLEGGGSFAYGGV